MRLGVCTRIEAGTSGAQADTMQAEAVIHKIWRRRGSIDQLKTDFQIGIINISSGYAATTCVTHRAYYVVNKQRTP